MRWSAHDPHDGWRTRFAIIPVTIEGERIWLKWYERRFCGEYYEVRHVQH